MIEHDPWIGSQYGDGVGGQRLALMGYSHWDENSDYVGKTVDTVGAIAEGELGARFFTTIRNAFGFSSHADFWPKVMFFNYIPMNIGAGAERYRDASASEYRAAEARFLRLVDQYRPDKVFAFSTKVWSKLPAGCRFHGPLSPACAYEWLSYEVAGRTLPVVLLRHPQGAARETLMHAIQLGLDLQVDVTSRDGARGDGLNPGIK